MDRGQTALDCVFAMMEERKLRVRDLFETLDADGSGSVDADELREAFAKHDMVLGVDDVRATTDPWPIDLGVVPPWSALCFRSC